VDESSGCKKEIFSGCKKEMLIRMKVVDVKRNYLVDV